MKLYPVAGKPDFAYFYSRESGFVGWWMGHVISGSISTSLHDLVRLETRPEGI